MSSFKKFAVVSFVVAVSFGFGVAQLQATVISLTSGAPTYSCNTYATAHLNGGTELDPNGTFSNLVVKDYATVGYPNGFAELAVTGNGVTGTATYTFDLAPGASSLVVVDACELIYGVQNTITTSYTLDGGASQILSTETGTGTVVVNAPLSNTITLTPSVNDRTVAVTYTLANAGWDYSTNQIFRGGLSDPVGFSATASFISIPEPSAIVLLATGLIGLLAYAWRKRR